jgi:hypothetical protein
MDSYICNREMEIMKTKQLIELLNNIEDKETRITLDYVGQGFIDVNSVYIESKPFGSVLTIGDYTPKGRKNLLKDK